MHNVLFGPGTVCTSCRGQLIDDGDELVCSNCGRVTPKVEESEGTRSSHLAPVDATRAALGSFLGPIETPTSDRRSKGFSSSNSAYRYLKATSDWTGRKGHDYSCARMIAQVCDKLSLSASFALMATMVARKVLAKDELKQLKPRPSLYAVSAYAIIAQCKLSEQRTITWKRVIEVFGELGHPVKGRTIMRVAECSPVRMEPVSPTVYLQGILSKVRNDPFVWPQINSTERLSRLASTAAEFLERTKSSKGGHNPRGLAATSLYAAEAEMAREAGRGRILTQKMVAEMAGVAEYTVREQYIEIFRDQQMQGLGKRQATTSVLA